MNARLLPLFSVLLVLAGPVVLFLSLENRLARLTAWPALALMAVGVTVSCIVAARRSGRWPKVAAGVNILLLLLFVTGLFVMARVPRSLEFASAQTAPGFTLSDHNGRSVSLRQELANGPVLLVFYRGHW